MEAWFNNPYATIVADFKYNSQLPDTLGHEAIFQIAVSNALGEWIIPRPQSIIACQHVNISRNWHHAVRNIEEAKILIMGFFIKDHLRSTMETLTKWLPKGYRGVKWATCLILTQRRAIIRSFSYVPNISSETWELAGLSWVIAELWRPPMLTEGIEDN